MIEISHIKKRELEGEVLLPGSKSISNRYLLLNKLAGSDLDLQNLSPSRDVALLQHALHAGGKRVDFEDAGTPLRFYLAYAALQGLDVWIDGGKRLRTRPIGPLISALEQLGAEFEYASKAGSLPLRVKKSIDRQKAYLKIDTSKSSQFLSALLMIGPCLDQGLTIETEGELPSAPYVDLTIDAMRCAGIEVECHNNLYKVPAGRYEINEGIHIEGDWSAATFIYGLAALADRADIWLPGLQLNSVQGDAITANIFTQLGIRSSQENNSVRLQRSGTPAGPLIIDFTGIPDMFPAIAAVCAALRIEGLFAGIKNLALKESDRIEAMRINLEQTGAAFELNADQVKLSYAPNMTPDRYFFKSFSDHRIAMACSIFAMQKPIAIDDETVVRKSFPSYWKIFNSLTM